LTSPLPARCVAHCPRTSCQLALEGLSKGLPKMASCQLALRWTCQFVTRLRSSVEARPTTVEAGGCFHHNEPFDVRPAMREM
jgi:hypothetical protein